MENLRPVSEGLEVSAVNSIVFGGEFSGTFISKSCWTKWSGDDWWPFRPTDKVDRAYLKIINFLKISF